MGKFTAAGLDVAGFSSSGQIAAVAASPWLAMDGEFAFALSGDFVGTGRLVQSFDGGTTVLAVGYGDGETKVFDKPERVILDEPERGILYRFEVLTRTGGTFRWRFAK